IRFFGRDELISHATSLRFHVFNGDSCAPTTVTIDLTSPPDRDGDGTPDCLEAPRDNSPPTWPPGSALAATTGGSAGTLVWNAAVDNVAVAGYRVIEDGSIVQEVDGATLTASVPNISANVAHEFQVQAFDAVGNVSTDGPATSVFVDTLSPTWPFGAALTVVTDGLSSATLSWPAASDSVGVTGYRVYQDDALITTIGALSATV